MNEKEIEKLRLRLSKPAMYRIPLSNFFNHIKKNNDPEFDKDRAYQDLEIILDELEEKQYKFDSYLETYEKLMNLIGDLSLQLKDCRRIISFLKNHLNFTITRNENRFDDVNYKLNFCGEKMAKIMF